MKNTIVGDQIMLEILVSSLLLLLGVVLNLLPEAAVLNVLWTGYVLLAHRHSNPKSKLTSKPRSTYTGRALS